MTQKKRKKHHLLEQQQQVSRGDESVLLHTRTWSDETMKEQSVGGSNLKKKRHLRSKTVTNSKKNKKLLRKTRHHLP